MSEPEWTVDDLPLTFERRRPRSRRLLATAAFGLGFVIGIGMLGFGTVVGIGDPLLGLGTEWPFGRWGLAGTTYGLGVLIVLAPVLYDHLIVRRRYGHCTIHCDGLRFVPPYGQEVFLSFGAVDLRSITPSGVEVSPLQGMNRLLIPTRDDEESARVLRLLDRLAPPPDQLEVWGIPVAQASVAYSVLVLYLLPVAIPVLLTFGKKNKTGGLAFFLAFLGAVSLRVGLLPWLSSLGVLRASLLISGKRIGWDEIRSCACDGGFLAIETLKGKRHLVHLRFGGEELKRALAWAPCPLALSEELPVWAGPGRRRLRVALGVLGWVIVTGLAVRYTVW